MIVLVHKLPLRLEGQVPPNYQLLCSVRFDLIDGDARPGTMDCPAVTQVDIARFFFLLILGFRVEI